MAYCMVRGFPRLGVWAAVLAIATTAGEGKLYLFAVP